VTEESETKERIYDLVYVLLILLGKTCLKHFAKFSK